MLEGHSDKQCWSRVWVHGFKHRPPTLPEDGIKALGVAFVKKLREWVGLELLRALGAVLLSLQTQDMQETQGQYLYREDPLEEEIATQSSILAWEIPWTEEPDGL